MSCNYCVDDASPAMRSAGVSDTQSQTTWAMTWQYLPRCPHCNCWTSPTNPVCNNANCPGRGEQVAQPVSEWPPEGVRFTNSSVTIRMQQDSQRLTAFQNLADVVPSMDAEDFQDIFDEAMTHAPAPSVTQREEWEEQARELFQFAEEAGPFRFPGSRGSLPGLPYDNLTNAEAYAYAQVAERAQALWWESYQGIMGEDLLSPIGVQQWSTSRDRMECVDVEFQSAHEATVRSASGRVYEVTEDSCTCPDWIYRRQLTGERCRHQDAVHRAARSRGLEEIFESGGWWDLAARRYRGVQAPDTASTVRADTASAEASNETAEETLAASDTSSEPSRCPLCGAWVSSTGACNNPRCPSNAGERTETTSASNTQPTSATTEAMSDVGGAVSSDVEPPSWAELYAERQTLLARREELRQEREGRWRRYIEENSEDLPSMVADDEAFEELMEVARSLEDGLPEYQTENVLGGSDITWGVEIECEGSNGNFGNRVARRLYDEGLCHSYRQEGYHSSREPGMFSVEYDGSLGSNGAEIISPIMRDTPEDWEKLQRVCQIIREEGGRVSDRCGGHVHIGSFPLDNRTNLYQRVVNMWGAFQDVVYRMAAEGEHRGSGDREYSYARPLSRRNLERRYSSVGSLRTAWARYYGLNMNNAGGSPNNTIEFRVFDGTVDERRVQNNVRVAAAFVDRARDDDMPEELPEPQRVGAHHYTYGEDDDGQGAFERFRYMLDTLSRRIEDRVGMAALFLNGQWQPSRVL